MVDTNLLNLLLKTLVEEKQHVSSIWGIVLAGMLMALPSILSYIKASAAEKNSKAAEATSRENIAISIDTKRINEEQVKDIKEIHAQVSENKGVQEQIHRIVNSGKTAMETRAVVQDAKIVDLSERLAAALEKIESLIKPPV